MEINTTLTILVVIVGPAFLFYQANINDSGNILCIPIVIYTFLFSSSGFPQHDATTTVSRYGDFVFMWFSCRLFWCQMTNAPSTSFIELIISLIISYFPYVASEIICLQNKLFFINIKEL